ncbi:unnamed protein product [Absidia cylindrospora]
MHAPFERKRRIDSDSDDNPVSKKPLLDNATGTDNRTDILNKEHNQRDNVSTDNDSKTGQEMVSTASNSDHVDTLVPYQRLVLVNVEVTCDENPTNPAAVQVTKENAEIIQLSFAIVKTSTMELIKEETIYVKPERTPLSQFCTQITGVTSEMLSKAGTLENAINVLHSTIQTEIIDSGLNFCFVSHGGWVLRIQLSREAKDKNIDVPSYIAQPCMFDLKQELQRWQLHHSDIHLRTTNIKELCNTFEIPMVRKGGNAVITEDNNKKIDDSNINILATTVGIIRYLTSFRHDDVFVYPIDTSADLEQFNKEESKMVHLAGLPYEVTQGELEAWFSSNDLRPATMWMMQMNEQMKPSLSGFVIFSQHDDAVRALLLNGRCLNDRVIEVSPSSERVVDVAYSIFAPFPLQAKARQVRPGDWNCPNCSFHNFASRQNCFRCNAENPSHSTVMSSAPTGPAASGAGDAISATLRGTSLSNSIAPSSSSSSSSSIPTTVVSTSAATGTTTTSTTAANSAQSYPYTTGAGHNTPGSAHTSSFTSGDWICTGCSFRNYSTRSQCMKCGTYRPSASTTPSAPIAGQSPHPFPPRPHHPASFRPGDWYCPNAVCGFQNFASRMACYRCHTANPNPAPQPSYGGSTGAAPPFGYDGVDSNSYYGAPNPAPGNVMAPGTGGHGFRAGDWYCPTCNSHNFASRFHCLKCRTAKPANPSLNPPPTYGGTGTGGFRGTPSIKSGDWVCGNPECGFHSKFDYCICINDDMQLHPLFFWLLFF